MTKNCNWLNPRPIPHNSDVRSTDRRRSRKYEDILSDSELDVLEHIYNKFVDFGAVEISNYSHAEKGYISTSQGEIISYSYAKDI